MTPNQIIGAGSECIEGEINLPMYLTSSPVQMGTVYV